MFSEKLLVWKWVAGKKIKRVWKKPSGQHLQVNIVHLFFCAKASFLSRAFDPFDLPSLFFFLKTDLLCAKNSLLFHRNVSPPLGYWCFCPRRGYDMVNQNFKAMGQYTHSRLFFFTLSLFLCLLSLSFFPSFFQSPGSNPHFSNEYKYLFCECVRRRRIKILSNYLSLCRGSRLQRSIRSVPSSPPGVRMQPKRGKICRFDASFSFWMTCLACLKNLRA